MIYDFLVIGAGISGSSAGYELSARGSTIIIEGESTPGYHSTGRSAALYTPNYGPELVRLINKQSYEFLTSPPVGFTTHAVLRPRGFMTVALKQHYSALKSNIALLAPGTVEVNTQEVVSYAPFLKADQVLGGIYEQGVFDMDVNAIHQGFLRGFAARGGKLQVDSPVVSLRWVKNKWVVQAGEQVVLARVVINAAGAWADEIGRLAGATEIGLIAKRRTAALVDMPSDIRLDTVPAMDFMGCSNYIKPEKNQIMISPGDEKPVIPQDIQPDDFDVAVLIDWLESTTDINVNKVNHQWAGLRCFVRDGNPVVGYDSVAKNFFWLAGQGGYGIMMASALARATAELITTQCLPTDFLDVGINAQAFSPNRLTT